MLRRFRVENYRSLRKIDLDLRQLNVVVGPNGSGKTNLYQALHLLGSAARGRFLETIAREGGLPSAKWAGEPSPQMRKKEPWRLKLGVELDDISYRVELGYPAASEKPPNLGGWLFDRDPRVKEELVWPTDASERAFLFRRRGDCLQARDDSGSPAIYPLSLESWELGISELREPGQFPELHLLRRRLAEWRFYHGFRSDPDAPARQARIGFLSPVLGDDGANLAAALRTIDEIGDAETLNEVVAEAFDGARVRVERDEESRFRLELVVPGLRRALGGGELSDGQLRGLCLMAALLSPRPPGLMVFNEPESSLHERVLPALARLLAVTSERTQVLLTTHSERLADELERYSDVARVALEKVNGETRVAS